MILKSHRRRIQVLFLGVLCIFLVLLVRLFHLQVLERDSWREYLDRYLIRTTKIWRKRGDIRDAQGRTLALSYTTWSLYADPKLIEDPPGTARRLATLLDLDEDRLTGRLSNKKRRFEWVQRKLDRPLMERIRALRIQGLGFQREYSRFHPNGPMAANVVGIVGTDNDGLEGVEYSYNETLAGIPGEKLLMAGLRGLELPKGHLVVNEPRGGAHLYLTLDTGIQHIAERALDRLIEIWRPKNAFVLVMDPNTGEILAMAMRPTYDPNDFGAYPESSYRNIALSEFYPPGSTFKLITASSALEEGTVAPFTHFYCPGFLSLWGIPIKCTSVHQDISLSQVIQKSCNVGAMRTGLTLGPEKFYQYIRKFGFGEKTGVELPGESPGLVHPPERWSGVSIGAVSMGQEIGVTGLQMACAVAAIVNGGLLLKPTIVKKITSHDEKEVLHRSRPAVRRRVISRETSSALREMMRGVVTGGSGRRAAIPDFAAAGKTGTSQKLGSQSRGSHSTQTKLVASFVGFVPFREPQYLIYIVANEPKDSPDGIRAWGGYVAAPAFAEMAERILWHKNITPDFASRALSDPQSGASAQERRIGEVWRSGETRR